MNENNQPQSQQTPSESALLSDNELIAEFMKRPYKAYHARFINSVLMSCGDEFDSRDACLAFCDQINEGKEADECYFPKPVPEFFNDFELKYDTRWDWLMPVVEKIESLMPHIKMPDDLEALRNGTHGSEPHVEVLSLSIASKITEVHEAVVKFIKWYNQQPKP